jgi:hypothetical protein
MGLITCKSTFQVAELAYQDQIRSEEPGKYLTVRIITKVLSRYLRVGCFGETPPYSLSGLN